ncbi:MAG: helix-turn-helix domain-containing protein [Christensenellaceae bacterium]|nr:helix-turn-helix domain-containing protein [Christensenellaceae bacterium]
MERLRVLTEALGFIERRVCGEVTPEEVAAHVGYSLSAMQKMFRHALHMGLADYITRRRITLAASDLLTTEDTVLEIALRYGYGSHEGFIRAFRRIWGETPSHFRQHRGFADIYPPLELLAKDEGGMTMTRQFDSAALYDAMKERNGTWAVAFDTVKLSVINRDHGRAAGDLVIAECVRRIDEAREEGMVFFRIGGDEFILLTGETDAAAAQRLADQVTAHNDEAIECGGVKVAVAMRAALMLLDTQIPNKEMLDELIDKVRWPER